MSLQLMCMRLKKNSYVSEVMLYKHLKIDNVCYPFISRDHGSAPEEFCPLQVAVLGRAFFERSAITHAANLPLPHNQCCPREEQRSIELGIDIVTGIARIK